MDNLIQKIKQSGIIGAGGAGFPTHVKLDAKGEYVIVNGAECEPLLRVDQQLMAMYPEELSLALEKVVELVGAKKGIFALKKKYKDATKNLIEYTSKSDKLDIFLMDNFYPAGDEQITVYEVLGRIIPEGGLPLNVGAVVVNVETLLNIYRAMDDIPVTETYLTITGAVKNPKTIKVAVGTSVREVIELAGGATVEEYEVIDGGPMMGKILASIDSPVVKSSKGFILLPKDHPRILSKKKDLNRMLKEGQTACCHCSLCTEVCPRNLIGHRLRPDRLMRIASYQSTCSVDDNLDSAYLCCECGLCEIGCIMDLQPWKLNSFLKGSLREKGIKNSNNNKPENAHPFREYKKFPVPKLVSMIGLKEYDLKAPYDDSVSIIPEKVRIMMSQHIGAPAKVIVNEGERVEKGAIIGEIREGSLGANIHSSISGIVNFVCDEYVEITRA